VGEVAMFFAISNFTTVNRAALFAARVAVGAIVGSSDGGIWGVSDPLCHPPNTVPGRVFGGRSLPRCMSLSSGRTALCPCHRRMRRSCRTRCPHDSRRLRARLSGSSGKLRSYRCTRTRTESRPETAPRRHLLPVFQPARLVRHVRSLAEHRSGQRVAITMLDCPASSAPSSHSASLRPLRAGGLDSASAAPEIGQLRDGHRSIANLLSACD
jgi:hypothetical protein